MKRFQLIYMMPDKVDNNSWKMNKIEVLAPQSTLDDMKRDSNATYGMFYCGDNQELYVPYSNLVRLKQIYK